MGHTTPANMAYRLFIFAFILFQTVAASAQRASNSVFLNFGRETCGQSLSGADISMFGAAQTASPVLLLNCDVSSGIGNIYSKFISFNGINNKAYVADISDGVNSKIYILNVGLPTTLISPTIAGPSYIISNYILNQFEFDPNGDLYGLSNYDPTTGTALIGAYDDTTGILKQGSLKTIFFPPGHFPKDVQNGDITILPNGRFFCVFGGDTSKLYEITRYQKNYAGIPVVNFLGSPSNVCYGLSYDNGYLVLTGTDFGSNCYAFLYNIANRTLSGQVHSPDNALPIDNASFSPSIGVAEKLTSAIELSSNQYQLTYQLILKNLGNVKVGRVQVSDDFGSVFGSSNISKLTATWASNPANLALDTTFNGTTNTNLLVPSQNLPNYPAAQSTATLRISFIVSNVIPNHYYNNSSVFTAKVGSGINLLQLSDSSNNYISQDSSWSEAVDPNNNNIPDDPSEGTPTPWIVGSILSVQMVTFDAHLQTGGVLLNWETANELDCKYFSIQRSYDCLSFDSVGAVAGNETSNTSHSYSFLDEQIPQKTTYYRLDQVNDDGSYSYSPMKVIEIHPTGSDYLVFPSLVTNFIVVENRSQKLSGLHVEIYNFSGTKIFNTNLSGNLVRQKVSLPSGLPKGYYNVLVEDGFSSPRSFKIFIAG